MGNIVFGVFQATIYNDEKRMSSNIIKIILVHVRGFEPVFIFVRLIEFDSNIQKEASKMPLLIDKLLFMIDRCQSDPAGYSLFSSQVASNTIFYCTFNIKSAQPLVDCGALEKMLNITKKLLNDKDSNTPLR